MFGMMVIRNSLKLCVLELATCMFIFVTIVCVCTLEVVCVCVVVSGYVNKKFVFVVTQVTHVCKLPPAT